MNSLNSEICLFTSRLEVSISVVLSLNNVVMDSLKTTREVFYTIFWLSYVDTWSLDNTD